MSDGYSHGSYHGSYFLGEHSRQEFEDLYRYIPHPIERRNEGYTIGIALIVDVGLDVIENVVPDWGIVLTPTNEMGPSTLYTIECTERYPTDFYLQVSESGMTHNEYTIRSSTRLVSQVYKLADIDNSIVPRHMLHSLITAFSPNRSGSFSPIDSSYCEDDWTSAHWVFRILYFMATIGSTTADDETELYDDEELLCSRRVVLPSVVNTLRGQYVAGRAIGSLKELSERIYHHWLFDGKMRPVMPGPVPVYVLP